MTTALQIADAGLPSGSFDGVLAGLVLAIFVSLLVALVAAGAAIGLRVRHILHARRRQALESEWVPKLMRTVVADTDEPALNSETPFMIARIRELPTRTQRALLELIVRFAFVVSGSARARLADLARPALPSAVALLDRRDPAFRALGVHIVGMLGLDRHESEILGALVDPAPVVGKTAARVLAQSRDPRFVEPILATASRLKHWGTSEVVSILKEVGPGAQPVLRSIFADTTRPVPVRVVCAETLRWLNDLGAAGPAIGVLREETDRELLSSTLRLIRRVGSRSDARVIRKLCTSHDPVVRLNAIAALAAVGDSTDDVELLAMALSDPSSWVAIRAATGLRELGRPELLLRAIEVGHPRADLARDVWPGIDRPVGSAAA